MILARIAGLLKMNEHTSGHLDTRLWQSLYIRDKDKRQNEDRRDTYTVDELSHGIPGCPVSVRQRLL